MLSPHTQDKNVIAPPTHPSHPTFPPFPYSMCLHLLWGVDHVIYPSVFNCKWSMSNCLLVENRLLVALHLVLGSNKFLKSKCRDYHLIVIFLHIIKICVWVNIGYSTPIIGWLILKKQFQSVVPKVVNFDIGFLKMGYLKTMGFKTKSWSRV